MSNFHRPDELERILESYSIKFEEFGKKFNSHFSILSLELKRQTDHLKIRIEKYSNYFEDHQLRHLTLSDHVQREIQEILKELSELQSKYNELDKMFRFGQNLL